MIEFNIDEIRKDFPGLSRIVNGHNISFLDSGASSQTPTQVLDAMNDVYNTHYANVHRGVYTTAQEISDQFEASRKTLARFINAKSDKEIIFNLNTIQTLFPGSSSLSAQAHKSVGLQSTQMHDSTLVISTNF